MSVEIYQSSTGDTSAYNENYNTNGSTTQTPTNNTNFNGETGYNYKDNNGETGYNYEDNNGVNDKTIDAGDIDVKQKLTPITTTRTNKDNNQYAPDYTQTEVNKMIIAGIERAFKTGVKINKSGNVVTINGNKL